MLEEKWKTLGFSNNFIFEKVLTGNPGLCRRLLELLLDIKIERIEPAQNEIHFQDSPGAKAVRFDVYVKDSDKIFDIEMQTTVRGDFPRRARYYQSCIDVSNLRPGEDYRKMKNIYIIFLCTKDPFGKKLPVYTFRNLCAEDESVKFEDGAAKIFYNAEKYDKMPNGELKNFFRYLLENKSNSPFTEEIERNVAEAKQSADEWRRYMTWEMEMTLERNIAFENGVEQGFEQGRSEGIETGFERGKIETAQKMLSKNIPLEIISECTGLPAETILSLKG